jgi:hypothetical protein
MIAKVGRFAINVRVRITLSGTVRSFVASDRTITLALPLLPNDGTTTMTVVALGTLRLTRIRVSSLELHVLPPVQLIRYVLLLLLSPLVHVMRTHVDETRKLWKRAK